VFALAFAGVANGGSFSCPFGKKAACLDYNDKVCSFMARCVGSDAVCFDSYTCDFKGFVCKSDFDDLADQHESLALRFEELSDQARNLLRALDEMQSCVTSAGSLLEAQTCAW
jgi:hypothetical protein